MITRQTFGSLALALCAGFSIFLIVEVFIVASATPDPRVTVDFSALFVWWRVIGTFCTAVLGLLATAGFLVVLTDRDHRVGEFLAEMFVLSGLLILGFTNHGYLVCALFIISSFAGMLMEKNLKAILWPWAATT